MSFGKRLISAAAVLAFAAAVLYGSMCVPADAVSDVEEPSTWFNRKETIYFWYSDDNLTNFINNAAVSFNERENVRVIPVLTSENEYLEALNNASLHSDQVPDRYGIRRASAAAKIFLRRRFRRSLIMTSLWLIRFPLTQAPWYTIPLI